MITPNLITLLLLLSLSSEAEANTCELGPSPNTRRISDRLCKVFECNTMDACETCQEIVSELQDILNDEFMREQLHFVIDLLCGNLPNPADQLCRNWSNEYLDQLIDEFLSQQPLQWCQDMRVC